MLASSSLSDSIQGTLINANISGLLRPDLQASNRLSFNNTAAVSSNISTLLGQNAAFNTGLTLPALNTNSALLGSNALTLGGSAELSQALDFWEDLGLGRGSDGIENTNSQRQMLSTQRLALSTPVLGASSAFASANGQSLSGLFPNNDTLSTLGASANNPVDLALQVFPFSQSMTLPQGSGQIFTASNTGLSTTVDPTSDFSSLLPALTAGQTLQQPTASSTQPLTTAPVVADPTQPVPQITQPAAPAVTASQVEANEIEQLARLASLEQVAGANNQTSDMIKADMRDVVRNTELQPYQIRLTRLFTLQATASSPEEKQQIQGLIDKWVTEKNISPEEVRLTRLSTLREAAPDGSQREENLGQRFINAVEQITSPITNALTGNSNPPATEPAATVPEPVIPAPATPTPQPTVTDPAAAVLQGQSVVSIPTDSSLIQRILQTGDPEQAAALFAQQQLDQQLQSPLIRDLVPQLQQAAGQQVATPSLGQAINSPQVARASDGMTEAEKRMALQPAFLQQLQTQGTQQLVFDSMKFLAFGEAIQSKQNLELQAEHLYAISGLEKPAGPLRDVVFNVPFLDATFDAEGNRIAAKQ